MKLKFLSITISTFILLIANYASASTNLDTAWTVLKADSGSLTTNASNTTTLTTLTFPPLNKSQQARFVIQYNINTITSSQLNLQLGTSSINLLNSGVSAHQNYVECVISPYQNTTDYQMYCTERNSNSTVIGSYNTTLSINHNNSHTLNFRFISGTASTRNLAWSFRLTVTDADGITTINEEDGLSHIRIQEEGTDIVTNPDVINFIGDTSTLTSSGQTGILTSTAGTGGGGGTETMAWLTEQQFWDLVNEFYRLFTFFFAFLVIIVSFGFYYYVGRR